MSEINSVPSTSGMQPLLPQNPQETPKNSDQSVEAESFKQAQTAKAIQEAQASQQVKQEQAAQQAKDEQVKEAKRDERNFQLPSYTVRYRVEGKQVSIHILDADGRLVRTVPPSELMKALQRDLLTPHVNLRG